MADSVCQIGLTADLGRYLRLAPVKSADTVCAFGPALELEERRSSSAPVWGETLPADSAPARLPQSPVRLARRARRAVLGAAALAARAQLDRPIAVALDRREKVRAGRQRAAAVQGFAQDARDFEGEWDEAAEAGPRAPEVFDGVGGQG